MPGEQLIIWNSSAGRVNAAGTVRAELEKEPNTEIYEPNSAEDSIARVQKAVDDGTGMIVAAGGDGTINSVINGLAGASEEVVLGVLPLGTANDWCTSLGISNDIPTAWADLQRGDIRSLDCIEVETPHQRRRFANIATGGNSYRVTEAMTEEMKQRWGALCYLRGAIDVLADLESFRTEIIYDNDIKATYSVWNIIVANGRTSAGNVRVAPRARLQDGLLDVVIIEDGDFLDLADLTGRYLFDEYIASERVSYRQAREIRIDSDPVIHFSLDGDLVEEQPISFRVLPGSLRVVVGQDFDAVQQDASAQPQESSS